MPSSVITSSDDYLFIDDVIDLSDVSSRPSSATNTANHSSFATTKGLHHHHISLHSIDDDELRLFHRDLVTPAPSMIYYDSPVKRPVSRTESVMLFKKINDGDEDVLSFDLMSSELRDFLDTNSVMDGIFSRPVSRMNGEQQQRRQQDNNDASLQLIKEKNNDYFYRQTKKSPFPIRKKMIPTPAMTSNKITLQKEPSSLVTKTDVTARKHIIDTIASDDFVPVASPRSLRLQKMMMSYDSTLKEEHLPKRSGTMTAVPPLKQQQKQQIPLANNNTRRMNNVTTAAVKKQLEPPNYALTSKKIAGNEGRYSNTMSSINRVRSYATEPEPPRVIPRSIVFQRTNSNYQPATSVKPYRSRLDSFSSSSSSDEGVKEEPPPATYVFNSRKNKTRSKSSSILLGSSATAIKEPQFQYQYQPQYQHQQHQQLQQQQSQQPQQKRNTNSAILDRYHVEYNSNSYNKSISSPRLRSSVPLVASKIASNNKEINGNISVTDSAKQVLACIRERRKSSMLIESPKLEGRNTMRFHQSLNTTNNSFNNRGHHHDTTAAAIDNTDSSLASEFRARMNIIHNSSNSGGHRRTSNRQDNHDTTRLTGLPQRTIYNHNR